MTPPSLARLAGASLALLLAGPLQAAPVNYDIDPSHSFPSFEADHMGLSVWRGKFNKTAGKVWLDKAAGSGGVDVVVEIDSVDFGLDVMNRAALGESLLDAARHPFARYQGRLAGFEAGRPSRVEGELSLRGVTRPLVLEIRRFKCMPHPLFKREVCGADAHAQFDRSSFGIDAGRDYGFDMAVALRIQIEAIATP